MQPSSTPSCDVIAYRKSCDDAVLRQAKKTRHVSWRWPRRDITVSAVTSHIIRQVSQHSLRNRAKHLCNIQWRGWRWPLKTPLPHMCARRIWSCYRANTHKLGITHKIGESYYGHAPLGWMAWLSWKQTPPVCITTPNLVVLRQMM